MSDFFGLDRGELISLVIVVVGVLVPVAYFYFTQSLLRRSGNAHAAVESLERLTRAYSAEQAEKASRERTRSRKSSSPPSNP